MQTIHTQIIPLASIRTLARYVFEQTLKDDPKAHFLFEVGPLLIFRVSTQKSLDGVKQILDSRRYQYLVYPYPKIKLDLSYSHPVNDPLFEEWDFITDHLDIFLPVFHANCMAATSFNRQGFYTYLERIVHTGCNPDQCNDDQRHIDENYFYQKRLGLVP